MTFPKTPSLSSLLRLGVGDIIQKINVSRFIGILSSYQQIIGIKKYLWGLPKNYHYRKMCIQFHSINSIENTVPKTRKRVFHIPDEYGILYENSAQCCAAMLAEHLGL